MCLYATYLMSTPFSNTLVYKTDNAYVPGRMEYPHSNLDYYQGANAQPNGIYAVSGPHPSDRVIASMGGSEDVRMDSAERIPQGSTTSPLYAQATNVHASVFVGAATQTHQYAWATCENLGACGGAGQLPGSVCTATQSGSGISMAGFCYESATGALQCGRVLELGKRLEPNAGSSGTHIGTSYYPSGMLRCPAGTPLDHPGRVATRRLLEGGCMIPTDANYRPSADVHVPEDCATPADYQKGCLFPGALNYAPGSKQSGVCRYVASGCTSSTALNYNSDASTDDGSCVEPINGCTLKADGYDGVDPNTPGYQSLYVGDPTPGVGAVTFTGYKAVLNYDVSANVLSGCIIAIEGCMDPTAVNYDSRANVNSNTWCVPPVTGCMMPSTGLTSVATAATAGRAHTRDGGAGIEYNPAATVHDLALCHVGRVGCRDPDARNYDPRATYNGTCYPEQDGCLDSDALNYNCTRNEAPYSVCTDAWPRATRHSAILCVFTLNPPPSPAPSFPPGKATVPNVQIVMVANGDASDFDDTKKAAIGNKFATEANVSPDKVTVTVTAASVHITIDIEVEDMAAAASVTSAIATQMASVDAATAFLSDVGVVVLSTPIVETVIVAEVVPPGPPPATPAGAIIGGVLGGIAAVGLLVGVYLFLKRRGAKPTYPA